MGVPGAGLSPGVAAGAGGWVAAAHQLLGLPWQPMLPHHSLRSKSRDKQSPPTLQPAEQELLANSRRSFSGPELQSGVEPEDGEPVPSPSSMEKRPTPGGDSPVDMERGRGWLGHTAARRGRETSRGS